MAASPARTAQLPDLYSMAAIASLSNRVSKGVGNANSRLQHEDSLMDCLGAWEPRKSQKEGQDDQGTSKQLGGPS